MRALGVRHSDRSRKKGGRMLIREIRIRDPFVYVEDGTYYILGTTGADCWNRGSDFTLYRSADLEAAEFAGTLVPDGALARYTQLWAPELHFYRDKYYLIVSVFCPEKKRGSMILAADRLLGPYQPLTGEYITPLGWQCLDATLFVREDRPYLYFSNEWVDPVTQDGDGGIFVAALSDDLTKLTSEPRKIVSGKYCGFSVELKENGRRGWVAEGPFVQEREGRIELYWSTFTEKGYCVARSFSSEVTGEYVFDRLIFDRDGGHAMLFTDLGGVRKIALHQPNRSPEERMKLYDLIEENL